MMRNWLCVALISVAALATGCTQTSPFGLTPANAQKFATDFARQLLAALVL